MHAHVVCVVVLLHTCVPGERIVVSCKLAHTHHPAPPAGHGRGRVGREVGVSLLVKPETRLICCGKHRRTCGSSLMKAARVLAEEHPCVTDRATTIHTLCDDRRTVRWRQSPCSHGRQARHIMSVFCILAGVDATHARTSTAPHGASARVILQFTPVDSALVVPSALRSRAHVDMPLGGVCLQMECTA